MKTLQDIKPKQFELKLTHPVDGSDLGASLLLVGEHSPQYLKAVAKAYGNRVENKVTKLSDEDSVAEMKEIMACCVVGWINDEFFGGPFTPEGIRAILNDDDFIFIRLLIKHAFDAASNFFLQSSIT